MSLRKRLLVKPPSGALVPSEHFGVVLYEGDGSSSHSINGGKFGAAFYGNGSSSKIDIGNLNLGGDAERTISAWINTNSLSSTQTIFQYGANSNGARFGFSIDTSGKPFVEYYNRDVTTSSSHISVNTWYHLVVTYNGNAIETATNTQIYVNGSAVSMTTSGAQTGSANTTDSNYGIGYDRLNTRQYFSGKLDQVRIFQKALSSSEVSTLYAETASTVESLDPLSEDTTDTLQVLGDSSCIATYRFENNEDDLSGNYNGTGTAIQYAAGRYGQAASFNDSSYINVASGSKPDLSTCTVSFWIKTNETANTGIIGEGYSSNYWGDLQCNILGSTGVLQVRYGNASTTDGPSVTSTSAINTGAWIHCAVSINDSELKIYINGSLETTHTPTVTRAATTNPFTIGALYADGSLLSGWYLNGEIDQVRIFNKILSASEVTTLYNENSLVASYRFEGNANDDTRNYDGTASNVTYEYGLNFTPDFVWGKSRDSADNHRLADSSRNAYFIYPNLTNSQDTNSGNGYMTFDDGGFTLTSANNNTGGTDYVAWCLKANGGTTSSNTDGNVTTTVQVNETAGFSIGTMSSTGITSSQTFGHGLGNVGDGVPDLLIVKGTSQISEWRVYSSALNNYDGFLQLHTTAALYTASIDSTFNSSTFNLQWTSTAQDWVFYAFKQIEGFSSFGTYSGNGSTNGPIVTTGFEPAFLLIKRTDSTGAWRILDNKRNLTNPRNSTLKADSTEIELTGANEQVDFLSNGFQIKTSHSGRNTNGGTYLYMAFAADPDTEAPTVAKSFTSVAYTGTGTNQKVEGLGFAPNLVWIKSRSTTNPHVLHDTVRGIGNVLFSNLTNAEADESAYFTSVGYDYLQFGTNAGNYNNTGTDYVAWAWKADDNEPTINTEGSIDSIVSANSNAGFSIIKYTGTGSTATVGHGLSSAPDMIIIKRLDGGTGFNWIVGHSSLSFTSNETLTLDGSGAIATWNYFNATAPTSTSFSLGTGANTGSVNTNGGNYIAYCFHSVSGFSKFGSYTGTGSSTDNNITTLGFRPDFVMIKRTDSTGDWVIGDSVREANGQITILANSDAAESNQAGDDIALLLDNGFRVRTNLRVNASGGTFIYAAFKIN